MEHYAILGVPADAAEDDIRSAYKALALKWHPDRQLQNAAEATGKFAEINNAYRGVLRERRRAQRKAEKQEQAPVASASNAPPPTPPDAPRDIEDLTELGADPTRVPVRQHSEASSSSTRSSSTTSHSSDSSSTSSHSSDSLDDRPNPRHVRVESSSSSETSSQRSSISSLFDDEKSSRRDNRNNGSHSSHSSTAPSSTSAPSSHRSTSSKPTPATSSAPPRACVYTCYTSSSSSSDDNRGKEDHPRSSRSSTNSTWSFRSAGSDHHSSHSSKKCGSSHCDGEKDHRSKRGSKCSRCSHPKDSDSTRRNHNSEKKSHHADDEAKSSHGSSRSSVKSGSSSRSSINSDSTSMYTTTAPIFQLPDIPQRREDSHSSTTTAPIFQIPGILQDSEDSHSSTKSDRSKLRKSPKPADPEPTSSSSTKSSHCHHTSDADNRSERVLLPEYDPPLLRELGGPKEWVFPLTMTLEEMYRGKKFRFRAVRYKLSGKKRDSILDFRVPAGCPNGTKIVFKGCGHECDDGTKQDVVFLVEEEKHEKFTRDRDDLIMDVRLPWVESLSSEKGEVHLNGIDGKPLCFDLDFVRHQAYYGAVAIPDAGMPRRDGGGRGNLVVRWEIVSTPPSRWGSIKSILSFKKG